VVSSRSRTAVALIATAASAALSVAHYAAAQDVAAGRRKAIACIRKICLERAEELGREELEETRIGRLAAKIEKLTVIADRIPGVEFLRTEAFSGEYGVSLDISLTFRMGGGDRTRAKLLLKGDVAGADAVGVQLSDPEEFRLIGGRAHAPLVSLWPRSRMTVFEFLQSGYRIALMPSSVPLAALAAAKQMLLELKEAGTERVYFNRQTDLQEVERWYRDLDIQRQ